MAKILLFDENGGIDKLYFKDVVPPPPMKDEVRYRVEAFALNRGDTFWLADTYYNSAKFPARIGQEAVGYVDAVGSDVTQFKVGDRVASLVQEEGKYLVDGEFAITPERYLCPCPEFLSPEEGAAMWSQALTAYYPLVEMARVKAGDWVLVTAGSGSAGNGAIQMAKLLGANVITTSRSKDKADFLFGIGADHLIVPNQENLAKRIREITGGHGVDVVLDSVAGSMMAKYLEDGALAMGAKIFNVGMLELDFELCGPVFGLVRTGASLIGYSIYNNNRIDEQLARAKEFIVNAIEQSKLVPVIDSVFPFEETIKGYERLLSGETRGKVVIRVS